MSILESINRAVEDRKQRLVQCLTKIKEQLIRIGALKIYLFGSLVDGEIDITSDIDLLVIMPSTKSTKQWMSIIYETIERGCSTDLIIFNLHQFENEYSSNLFLQQIIQNGEKLYETSY